MTTLHPNLVAHLKRKYGPDWCPEEAQRRKQSVLDAQNAAIQQRPITDRLRRKFNQQRYSLLRKVLDRGDAYACRVCGEAKNLHLDHVVPLSKGGTNDVNNLQLLCSFHNVSKGRSA